LRLGAVLVPLLTSFAPSAIAERLTGSGATLVVCEAEHRTKLDPGPHMSGTSTWQIATTGDKILQEGDHTLTDLTARTSFPTPELAVGGNTTIAILFVSSPIGPPRGVRVPACTMVVILSSHSFGLGVMDHTGYGH